jgi:hypothetical protein
MRVARVAGHTTVLDFSAAKSTVEWKSADLSRNYADDEVLN